jgi:PTH1 family peptidyl-tRNA hydrolase
VFEIGKGFSKGEQVNYVLGKWSELEKKELEKALPLTSDIITSFIFEGIEKTMNTFN